MKNLKINELYIKYKVMEQLRSIRVLNNKAIVANEYCLGHAGRRVDLAVWGKEFVGIEIKSKYDSLKRLHDQLDVYKNCFDRVLLIVAEKHVENSLLIAPPCVDVWSIDDFGKIRPIRDRSEIQKPNVQTVLKLLKISDLKRLNNLPSSARASRSHLENLSQEKDFDAIRECLRVSFYKAFVKTSDQFFDKTKRKKISPLNIVQLSRFIEQREANRKAQAAEREYWNTWNAQARMALGEN